MLLTPAQRIIVETGGDLSKVDNKASGRAIMKDEKVLWLANDKTVPYTVTDELGKR